MLQIFYKEFEKEVWKVYNSEQLFNKLDVNDYAKQIKLPDSVNLLSINELINYFILYIDDKKFTDMLTIFGYLNFGDVDILVYLLKEILL